MELFVQDIEILDQSCIDIHYRYVSTKMTLELLFHLDHSIAYTSASTASSWSQFGNVSNSLATSSASGRKYTCHFSKGYSSMFLILVILSLCGLIRFTAHHSFFNSSASLLWNHTDSKLIAFAFRFLYRFSVALIVFCWLFSLPLNTMLSNT